MRSSGSPYRAENRSGPTRELRQNCWIEVPLRWIVTKIGGVNVLRLRFLGGGELGEGTDAPTNPVTSAWVA